MGSTGGNFKGHACIVIGEAREMIERAGLPVRVERLVELLRREGVPEENLQSVAVVVHPPESEIADGGGAFNGKATVTYRKKAEDPARDFSICLHTTINGELPLSFLVLHEAGHAWTFYRGKRGWMFYGKRAERWLGRVSKALLVALALLWLTLFVLDQMSGWAWAVIPGVAVLLMLAIRDPHVTLWLASPVEWKANWFAWRHRRVVVVGGDPDGTEMLYAPSVLIT